MSITHTDLIAAMDHHEAATALGTLWPLKLLTAEEFELAAMVLANLDQYDLERALKGISQEQAEREAIVSLHSIGPIPMLLASAYQFMDSEGLSSLVKSALNSVITKGKANPDPMVQREFADVETSIAALPAEADLTGTIMTVVSLIKRMQPIVAAL